MRKKMKAGLHWHKQLPGYLLVGLLACTISACSSSPEASSAQRMAAGRALMRKNDPTRAILEFKTAVQATPKNAEAHYELGSAYLAVGDLGKGAASLRRALELNPKYTAAQLRLAQVMAIAGDQELQKDAQERLQALLEERPDNPDVLHALALSELKLGNPKQAMQHLERALAAAPHELILAITLAQTKLEQKDLKGAEDVLKEACKNSPNSADCLVIMGRLYAAENRMSEAEQKFQQALSMQPNHVAALLNLATLQ